MQCHPHDSICGCSIDQVHEEMRPRFDQVGQVGEAITQQSLAILANAADTRFPPSSSNGILPLEVGSQQSKGAQRKRNLILTKG